MKYYGLYDILRRNKLNTTFLRTFLSSTTVTRLSKGENVSADILNKLCYVLDCNPSDIMEFDKEDYTEYLEAQEEADKLEDRIEACIIQKAKAQFKQDYEEAQKYAEILDELTDEKIKQDDELEEMLLSKKKK